MDKIISKIKTFLVDSSDHYNTLIQRKKRDIEIYGGNFWNDDTKKCFDRENRICRNFTQYSKYSNAITSPFTKSPYHAEIDDENGIYSKVQEEFDKIENDSNTKYILNKAVMNAAITGTGFFTLSIDNGKISPELVRDNTMVALDPNIQTIDGCDAECGAIVNFMSIKKAKRLYGDEICGYKGKNELDNIGDQWTLPKDNIALVTYWEMNENGLVDMYQVCGNIVVKDKIELAISRIPLYRVCFNEVIRNNKVDYNGIVDMTADLQLGMNLGYSTLLERANRSPKASYMMPAGALDGLDEFYEKLQTKESLVCLYNGDKEPTPIIESYQTADLMSTIQTCNDLMSSTIGIPSQGLNPVSNSQTATEILIQQNNSESNVNVLYENANEAIFQFSKSVIELLCWLNNIDELPTFKLINGPQVITKNMKKRQELIALSSLLDEKGKKIVAKQYIETLDKDLSEPLLVDIIANSDDITYLSDSEGNEDPQAVAIMNKYQMVLEETQNELEMTIQAVNEKQKEIDMLTMQLMNQKQDQLLQMQKHIDETNLKQQQLDIDRIKTEAEIGIDIQEDNRQNALDSVKLQKEMVDLEQKKYDLLGEIV